MKDGPDDTIAAISTPLGMGGIGIVRLSGPQAGAILAKIFRRRSGSGPLRSHRFYLGEAVRPDGTVLDEVLAVFMEKPKTYTREDVGEIQAHGGPLILGGILESAIQSGCRLAEPGEFTKRAFLNGRIDLTQAEAVADLIQSKTRRSLELANLQRQGRLAEEVRQVREELLSLTALLEAGIDFPDEDLPEISGGEIQRRLGDIRGRLESLLRTYGEGKIYREGVSAVIVGRPNVGKSSLLNSLLREDRAIVTPFPGTTRDVIEEIVNVRGVPLKIMDTAGLRSAGDEVEMEGVRRTRDRLGRADLVIWVLDGSESLTPGDLEIFSLLRGKKTVAALNKNDLPLRLDAGELAGLFPEMRIIPVSALRHVNIDLLEDAIRAAVLDGTSLNLDPSPEAMISNLRHKQAAENACHAVCQAEKSLEANLSAEFITLDLSRALQDLGEITGETTSEELLNRIFSQFCIGK